MVVQMPATAYMAVKMQNILLISLVVSELCSEQDVDGQHKNNVDMVRIYFLFFSYVLP